MHYTYLLATVLFSLLSVSCSEGEFQDNAVVNKGDVQSAEFAPPSAEEPKTEPTATQASNDPEPVEVAKAPEAYQGSEVLVPDTDPPPLGVVVVDNGIEFGSNEVFRIGDGFASSSSCLTELDSFNLSGTTFFFEFSVLNDDTDVDVSIGKVCGIDGVKNTVSLFRDNNPTPINQKVLPSIVVTDSQPLSLFPTFKLKQGTYSIAVASGISIFGNYDYDDFLVGKIRIKANKQVKALGIYSK